MRWWLGLVPLVAAAQGLQLRIVEAGVERAVTGLVDVGAVPAGDDLDTRFRVRNTATNIQSLTTLTVAGTGFRIQTAPSLPVNLAAGEAVDFLVRFSPPAFGGYSATLAANTLTVLLRGSAPAVPALVVEQGGLRFTVSTGATIEFGSAMIGSSVSRRLTLENRNPATIEVATLALAGPFSTTARAPLTLAAGDALPFDVEFRPETIGETLGTIRVDGRTFRLQGNGLPPPFPRPAIGVEPATVASGRQVRVRVNLESPARGSGSGEMRLEFRPAVTVGPADPAILFVSSGARAIAFTVADGESVVRFGGSQDTVLQTGTTAGSVLLIARLGEWSEELSLMIPPAAVSITDARMARTATGVDVILTGFDNTRTVSALVFTFFDSAEASLATVNVDAGAAFRSYFETAMAGGAFQLRAAFPIAGDASRVGAVEVAITNSAGTTRGERIRF